MDEQQQGQDVAATVRPAPDARRPYQKPRVRSSEVFERAAAGCGFPGPTVPPCNGSS